MDRWKHAKLIAPFIHVYFLHSTVINQSCFIGNLNKNIFKKTHDDGWSSSIQHLWYKNIIFRTTKQNVHVVRKNWRCSCNGGGANENHSEQKTMRNCANAGPQREFHKAASMPFPSNVRGRGHRFETYLSIHGTQRRRTYHQRKLKKKKA